MRHLLRDYLLSRGFVVLEASNGQQALYTALTARHLIHLLLTDIEMPGMNGFELANQMKMLKPRIKTIFMSANLSDHEWKSRAAQEGSHFLQKPFSLQELDSLIAKVLAEQKFRTGRPVTVDGEGSVS